MVGQRQDEDDPLAFYAGDALVRTSNDGDPLATEEEELRRTVRRTFCFVVQGGLLGRLSLGPSIPSRKFRPTPSRIAEGSQNEPRTPISLFV